MEQTIKISLKGFHQRQKEIAYDIINTPSDTVKYFVIRASRKSGKTWMLARLLIYFAIKYPKSELGFVSASWSFTSNFYRDLSNIVPKQLVKKNNIGTSLELANGSIIDFYSANSNVLPVNRSFDFLFADEHALYKPKVWDYIRPTVLAKPNAKVIVASTPRGKNAFYDMCQLGISNKSRHRHYRMSYLDNPNTDLKQVEDDKNSMSSQMFSQEYECEFTEGISGVFGDFRKLMTISKWIEPNEKDEYFFGIDVGGAGEDDTILTIMNSRGRVHLIYECESNDLVIQGNELSPLIKKYNAKGYCEKNGIGQGLADVIRSLGCDVTYWNTSNQSKQKLVTNTIININKNELELPTDTLCPKLENQMSTFIGRRTSTGLITYQSEKGLHDDYVFSLLFANEARKNLSSGLQIWDKEDEDDIFISVDEHPRSLIELKHRYERTNWSETLKY